MTVHAAIATSNNLFSELMNTGRVQKINRPTHIATTRSKHQHPKEIQAFIREGEWKAKSDVDKGGFSFPISG
jgi:hypothetical protein